MVSDEIHASSSERWNPTSLERLIWVVLGLALFIFLFGVYTNIALAGSTITIGFDDLVIAILTINAVWLVHQFIHGFALDRMGGKPFYRLAWIAKMVPVAQVSSTGTSLSRGQFAVVVLLPFLLISGVGLVATAILTGKSALPLALALHGACCVRDLWSLGVAWRQPPGTTFTFELDGLYVARSVRETGAA